MHRALSLAFADDFITPSVFVMFMGVSPAGLIFTCFIASGKYLQVGAMQSKCA
jgi:hypothetical protein